MKIIIIIIIIIIINCNLVVTRWQWLFYMYTKYEMECWEPSQRLLIDTGKPRKTCVEMDGSRTFRVLTTSQHSGI